MKASTILDTIGDTPHVKINKLFGDSHDVWIKLEKSNPGASIKDRIALAMIDAAEADGTLTPDTQIIEPTSGNTGIGLALVCAVKGYALTLVMPESMSLERRRYIKALGATIVLTTKEGGMPGAIEKAQELVNETKHAWMPQQFLNPANVHIHEQTTAQEILKDFPNGIDYLITGVGTGGHISGCAAVLKEAFPQVKVFAVEPEDSPVISGGAPGPHPIQGIGPGFIPEILATDLLDGTVTVSADAAREFARKAVAQEGLFMGLSSGASLAALAKKLPDIPAGSTILTFCYDTGERYLSVDELFAI